MPAVFALLYSADPRFGALNRRFLPPDPPAIEYAGVALTAAGVGFAIWARAHLGKYWSGDVTIRQEHRLIRSGPYQFIRHPIYSGMLLALVGSVLVIGEYRALLGFAIILLGFVKKARKEESFLKIAIRPRLRRTQAPHRILPAAILVMRFGSRRRRGYKRRRA